MAFVFDDSILSHNISVIGGLFALTSAQNYTESVPVVCSGAPPSTITQTVTVTEGGSCGHHQIYPTTKADYPISSDYITTAGGTVTSINYDGGSRSTIYVYPTGIINKKHCTVATYDKNIVINVSIVDITIIIIDGERATKTVTATDSATYTPTPPPIVSTTTPLYSTGTSNRYGNVHHVIVGAQGKNVYSPNQIDAKVGDVIRFNFLSKNHTVTQSSFNKPCTFNGGFDTGFNQFNPDNKTYLFVKDFIVNTNKPIWFHCAKTQPRSHCQAGMVLGINPAGTFDAFLENAKNSDSSTFVGSETESWISVVPAPVDAYTTISGTGSWIPGVPAPTGYYAITSQAAESSLVYNYSSIKGRSLRAEPSCKWGRVSM